MSKSVRLESLDNYLTVTQAAEFLGVAADTLRNWDKSGRLKARRHPMNGYRLYRQEDLEAILRGISHGGTGRKSREEQQTSTTAE